MTQYNYSPAQLAALKRKHAQDAEAEKDIRTWDTPYDEPMSLAEAREAARKERDKWKSRYDMTESSSTDTSDQTSEKPF